VSSITDFPTPDMAFAERLAQLRKERGLTLQALGELSEVHWTQIQRYEAGAAQPTLDVLKRLAHRAVRQHRLVVIRGAGMRSR
jgi:transcriptional regulator with XRE-family HTH domain